METFTLVPNLPNPIVECHNLNLPVLREVEFKQDPGYNTADGYTRYVGPSLGKYDVETIYFNDMMRNTVMPLLYSHERFNWTWPISLQTLLDHTTVKVTLIKDEIGFWQGKHEDPKIFVISGILHMQDCEQGTYFTAADYTAPTKKFSGAFWSNSQWSHHEVPVVTSERLAYLVIVQWTFLNFHAGWPSTGK